MQQICSVCQPRSTPYHKALVSITSNTHMQALEFRKDKTDKPSARQNLKKEKKEDSSKSNEK